MPNDNTPILIGSGLTVQKEKDAQKAKSPMALLAEAATRALPTASRTRVCSGEEQEEAVEGDVGRGFAPTCPLLTEILPRDETPVTTFVTTQNHPRERTHELRG